MKKRKKFVAVRPFTVTNVGGFEAGTEFEGNYADPSHLTVALISPSGIAFRTTTENVKLVRDPAKVIPVADRPTIVYNGLVQVTKDGHRFNNRYFDATFERREVGGDLYGLRGEVDGTPVVFPLYRDEFEYVEPASKLVQVEVPASSYGTAAVTNNVEQLATEPTPEYYERRFRGAKLDPYRVLLVYGISHPAQQHAIKKLLRAGGSIKSVRQDVEEVIASLNRWLEILEEDDREST